MNYGQIINIDTANGEGIRLSLFVSGCRHHCENCFNPETWNFEYGQPFTEQTKQMILSELSKPQYAGLTILGGDPLEPENQETIYDLMQAVKSQLQHKTIWIYTGNIYEELLQTTHRCHTVYLPNILELTDVLVDGPYVESLKNMSLKFRGSENQRILRFTRP